VANSTATATTLCMVGKCSMLQPRPCQAGGDSFQMSKGGVIFPASTWVGPCIRMSWLSNMHVRCEHNSLLWHTSKAACHQRVATAKLLFTLWRVTGRIQLLECLNVVDIQDKNSNGLPDTQRLHGVFLLLGQVLLVLAGKELRALSQRRWQRRALVYEIDCVQAASVTTSLCSNQVDIDVRMRPPRQDCCLVGSDTGPRRIKSSTLHCACCCLKVCSGGFQLFFRFLLGSKPSGHGHKPSSGKGPLPSRLLSLCLVADPGKWPVVKLGLQAIRLSR
jgi:hypothetical protein